MQTGCLLAKGGERTRQEALWRGQERFHAEMYEERLSLETCQEITTGSSASASALFR